MSGPLTARPCRSPQRADYILVQYIEPVATNSAALGYDLQSDAVRNAAITQATDSGEVVATAPITLVQETGSQQGILAVLAVYDDARCARDRRREAGPA